MDYTVYCDESRHDGGHKNTFMAIGGLWVPTEKKASLTRALKQAFMENNIHAEVKWNKASKVSLDGYKRLIDLFFDDPDLCFRVIVIEQAKLDHVQFHGGDKELGFYKFYYEMLVKWLTEENQYVILLDYQKNKGADRYTTLRTILERSVRGKAWIKELTVIDSSESPIAQLADLLTGAVAAEWCGIRAASPKAELAAYIAAKLGKPSLRFETASPDVCKFNVFRIAL